VTLFLLDVEEDGGDQNCGEHSHEDRAFGRDVELIVVARLTLAQDVHGVAGDTDVADRTSVTIRTLVVDGICRVDGL
jgi:hypothetical protein